MNRSDARRTSCSRPSGKPPTPTPPPGGPDAFAGIYPVVATVTGDGFVRLDDDELKQRYEVIAAEQVAA